METRRTSLSYSTSQQQQSRYGIEMTQRPNNNIQHRMRSVSVVAFPTTSNSNYNMNSRNINNINHHRALEISSGFGGGSGRKSSSIGGRRISLPNNLRKLPLRKKSSAGSKFKFEPTIDPWDEIFMIYVSSFTFLLNNFHFYSFSF